MADAHGEEEGRAVPTGPEGEPEGHEAGSLIDRLEESEAELERRRARLLRVRGYFAWRLPVLLGVWYFTRGTPIQRFVILAFVLALALDYLIAALRVRSAEKERDSLSDALRLRGQD